MSGEGPQQVPGPAAAPWPAAVPCGDPGRGRPGFALLGEAAQVAAGAAPGLQSRKAPSAVGEPRAGSPGAERLLPAPRPTEALRGRPPPPPPPPQSIALAAPAMRLWLLLSLMLLQETLLHGELRSPPPSAPPGSPALVVGSGFP